jgi:hypothetical protein
MGFHLCFRGAQIVAIEIDSIIAGREGAIGGAELFKNERLVSAVSHHRVSPAGEEIAWVALVGDAR